MIYLCLVHCHRFLFSLALIARPGIAVNTGAWPTLRPSSSDTVLQHDFQSNGQTIQGDNGRDFEITRSGLMCKLQDQLHSCGHCIKAFTGSIIRKPGKLLYFWFGSLDRTKKCIQTTCIIYYKQDLCNLPSFIQF